jgi:hypothetical protein
MADGCYHASPPETRPSGFGPSRQKSRHSERGVEGACGACSSYSESFRLVSGVCPSRGLAGRVRLTLAMIPVSLEAVHLRPAVP